MEVVRSSPFPVGTPNYYYEEPHSSTFDQEMTSTSHSCEITISRDNSQRKLDITIRPLDHPAATSAAQDSGDCRSRHASSPTTGAVTAADSDETQPLLRSHKERQELQSASVKRAKLAIMASLAVNFCLTVTKLVALIDSRSLSVMASLLDSVLDLTAQCVIWYTHRQSSYSDPSYPAGKSRLSPLGILFLAILMFGGAVEVTRESAQTIYDGTLRQQQHIPRIEFNLNVILSLVVVIGTKGVLWWYCGLLRDSPDVQALAADHRNDVLSNLVALACGVVAFQRPPLWYVDPVGAIVISVYIGGSWFLTGRENMAKLVGKEADAEVLSLVYEKVEAFSAAHPGCEVDWLRSYYLGHNVVVEVELVLPAQTLLPASHDSALSLQQQIEDLDVVERCYVHVDYQHRNYDEHKFHSFPFSSFKPQP